MKKPKSTFGVNYYVNDSGNLYIEEVYNNKTWGWYMWYDNRFMMCVRSPEGATKVTKEEFDRLYFLEKL